MGARGARPGTENADTTRLTHLGERKGGDLKFKKSRAAEVARGGKLSLKKKKKKPSRDSTRSEHPRHRDKRKPAQTRDRSEKMGWVF